MGGLSRGNAFNIDGVNISVTNAFSYSGGVTTTPTVQDTTYTQKTGVTATPGYVLTPNTLSGSGLTFSFASDYPAVASINSSGAASRVSNGNSTFTISCAGGSKKSPVLDFTNSTTATTYVLNNYVAGSLGKHIVDSINALISGKTPAFTGGGNCALYTSYDGNVSAPNVTRNSGLYCTLDLNSISVTTGFASDIFPVTLITPQHITAGHVGANNPIIFKDSVGNYLTRNTISSTQIAPGQYIYKLNAPVATVPPAYLMPSNWRKYLPHVKFTDPQFPLPFMYKRYNDGDFICIGEIQTGNQIITAGVGTFFNSALLPWSLPVIGGDSNGQLFVPINGKFVLLSSFYFSTNIDWYGDYTSVIDSFIAGSGYAANYVDLSGFTFYA